MRNSSLILTLSTLVLMAIPARAGNDDFETVCARLQALTGEREALGVRLGRPFFAETMGDPDPQLLANLRQVMPDVTDLRKLGEGREGIIHRATFVDEVMIMKRYRHRQNPELGKALELGFDLSGRTETLAQRASRNLTFFRELVREMGPLAFRFPHIIQTAEDYFIMDDVRGRDLYAILTDESLDRKLRLLVAKYYFYRVEQISRFVGKKYPKSLIFNSREAANAAGLITDEEAAEDPLPEFLEEYRVRDRAIMVRDASDKHLGSMVFKMDSVIVDSNLEDMTPVDTN